MLIKKNRIIIIFAILFIFLCVGTALTKRPWSDEGWFAAAGYNLAFHGKAGTLVLEPRGFREGIDRYTYWTAPLYYPLQAVWYRLFGFGLFSMRSLSTIFGLIYLFSWYSIAKNLLKDQTIAVLVFVLLAADYIVVMGGSFGRMDIICAAFGAGALAVYLWRREKSLTQAIFFSQTLAVLSGLTHYFGILYFIGLVLLTLSFDRSSIRPKHIFLAAVPYLIGAAAWGAYIWQEPSLFVTQFFGNATDTNRMNGFRNPFAALSSEIVERYLKSYGLSAHSAGSSGPVYLKSLTLVAYLIGLFGVIFVKKIRQQSGVKLLFAGWLIFFLIMTILDGQKLSYYLLNIIPFYVIFLAAVSVYLWRQNRFPRPLIALCLSGLLLLQIGGLLLRMRTNGYGNSFQPAADFIKAGSANDSLTMASAEMAFALGFEGRIADDHWLGYGTGKKPQFFVVEEVYENALDGKKTQMPEIYQYVSDTLENEYELVYDQNHYKIYARKNFSGGEK